MPENKILVIRGGAIGDFILTLPVLAALRRQFPQTRLEVLGYPHIASLAVAGGLADDARPIESRALAGFFARDGELDPALRDYFASFAIILSFLYDPDGIFEANVKRCSRAQFIAGPHRPDDNAGLHATEVFLQPLARLAIFDADPVPRLTLSPPHEPLRPSRLCGDKAEKFNRRDAKSAENAVQGLNARSSVSGSSLPSPLSLRLALHPGSGSERKNWPEEKWAELLRRLAAETPDSILLVGGEAEGDRLPRLARTLPPARCEVCVSQPLVEVARRLHASAAFAGHDSGLTHLAAALGVPTLALWGPTPQAVWAPRGGRVTLLRAPDTWANLSVDEVFRALARLPRDASRS